MHKINTLIIYDRLKDKKYSKLQKSVTLCYFQRKGHIFHTHHSEKKNKKTEQEEEQHCCDAHRFEFVI